jgi:hypothetical protein
MFRRPPRAPLSTRAIARFAMLTVLAVSVFAATVRAGTQYYFCNMMQEQRSEPCCRQLRTEPLLPGVQDASCCESVIVDSLPSGAATQLPRVSPAPLARSFTVPALAMDAVSSAAWGLRASAAPRAGPLSSVFVRERRMVRLI